MLNTFRECTAPEWCDTLLNTFRECCTAPEWCDTLINTFRECCTAPEWCDTLLNTFRECCTAPEWCDTLLTNMNSDLDKLRFMIQMVTAVFCEMLDMDNVQPVETTPLLQCVSYSLMDDIYQIKCIKPPQEHLIDISQEDQWMRHTPTGFNLVKDEQLDTLDNTQYLYIATLCLYISYKHVKNDGKHCDQEISNNHHRISDHLKIDFALSNIPDVSRQNMNYSCWWSNVDKNSITKLVTRRYVSNHIRMDYAPGNKPEIFQESINLLSGVYRSLLNLNLTMTCKLVCKQL